MPAVSVIVPVYNTEKYLEECIRSLAEQTLPDIELIFVDDGSQDASPRILEAYRTKYPERIRVITQPNGGQGSARNAGIRAARGEYVGFVDSDDYVDRRMYAAMYTKASSDDLDLVECDFHYLEESGREKRSYRSAAPWNKLIRKRILTEQGILFPEGCIYEDTSFYLKLLPYIRRRAKMLGVYVYHRDRGDSAMNGSSRAGNIFPVLQDALEFYRDRGLMEKHGKELEYFCTRVLLCSSMGRISRIPDPKCREALRRETFTFLQQNFPEYRKNPYLGRGLKGQYLKLTTPGLCRLLCGTLRRCPPGGITG